MDFISDFAQGFMALFQAGGETFVGWVTRDEDPREIANEIKSGISDTNNIFIADRYAAIRQAIESANVKDTVLILGKGDEVFMYREFGREPWMGDHNVARHCIRKYSLGLEDDEK